MTREARIFARYLVGRSAPCALIARYGDAVRTIWPAGDSSDHDSVLEFVRRHPWSVGPLDATTSLLRPGCALRARLLTMAAVLEASPEFAGEFLPRDTSLARLAWTLVASGATTALQAVAGLALLPMATRSPR